ncbi:alpha-amylase family glycosyl hydrolase [Sphingomonas jaspsi]|uniref:alpha-amylase family glycosyl hydrolase n=1 Tax=Sphingomonas jaspsi TaxID=392409 RepID=UPI00068461D4|nr:alpha-amylase family glycosyl hydrolase [Sphingomonas jaspsi]
MSADLAMTRPVANTATSPWWKGAVIYQLYPRSYADSNGDGIGDLKGATERLDHIASLGCDGVWVSPFFTSPMKDFGYDVADYCDVDPIFGTLADFDALVAKAHALGLKVIIDQVYSHTSDEHPWFRESRSSRDNAKADWYVWADPKPDGSPPSNWQSVFGGPAWTWDARREQYYLHNFLKEQPQLHVHNREVQDALLGVAKFWLDRGVDGFRLDALNFAMHDPALTDNPPVANPAKRTRPFDFQHHFHNQSHADIPGFIERVRALMNRYDAAFSLAEVGGEQAPQEMKLYTAGDARLNSAYGFDYLYAEQLTPDVVRDAIRNWPGGEGEGWPSWAFSNHDAPRFASRWWPEAERDSFVRVAMLLLASLRGNAIIYQGEELGLPQAHVPFEFLQDPEAIANWPQTLGRDGARTPMPWTDAADGGFGSDRPWLPVDPAHLKVNVAHQDADAGSILNWTRRVIALRHQHPALREGSIRLVDGDHPSIVAFEREAGGQRLRCVFNLSRDTIANPVAGGSLLLATGSADPSAEALPPASGYVALC